MDCDRILVMDNGQLVEDGSPKELKNIAGGKFVALLKATQHNV